MNKYAVMRKPVLMEDEGREFYINNYETEEEANAWIESQKGKYFRPSDYYVLKGRWCT